MVVFEITNDVDMRVHPAFLEHNLHKHVLLIIAPYCLAVIGVLLYYVIIGNYSFQHLCLVLTPT
jgi:hypothetical protein